MTTPPQIELGRELSEQLTVHKNIGQEIVLTTVDKVRICLMETRDSLSDQKEWVAPLAVLVPLVTSLVAADFRDVVLSKAAWQASYIIASVLCAGWLVVSGRKAWRNRSRGSIDYIVNRLKADTTRALGQADLVIHTAIYAAAGKSVDLTEALTRKIIDGRLEIVATNELGGDPNYGVAKELVVEYAYQGQRLKKTVREGETLSLP